MFLAGAGGSARAALCGGTVACGCGDTVVESTTFTGELGVCDTTGLRIRSGVVLVVTLAILGLLAALALGLALVVTWAIFTAALG